MSQYTIRLDQFYDGLYNLTGDDEFFNDVVSKFQIYSGESNIELYLKNKALPNMKLSKSVTFITIDSYSGQILGFYTIAISFIPILEDDDISATVRKKLRGLNVSETIDVKIAVSYLIGQLGRSINSEKGFGKTLLDDAIHKIATISGEIGCNVIRIDCKDEPNVMDYYQKNGFLFIKKDEISGLNILVRYIRSK